MLFRDEARASPFNAARYEDHRRVENTGRDDRIKKNVEICIENLQPDAHNSINDTYVRIMARNRPEEDNFGAAADDDS